MTFVTVSNLIWVVGAVLALMLLGYSEIRPHFGRSRRERLSRALCVTLVLVALFPCVSASDDLIRYGYYPVGFGARWGGNPLPEKSNEKSQQLQLVRLLESLDNFRIAAVCCLILILYLVGSVRLTRFSLSERHVPCLSGRSPPGFFPAY